MAENDSSSLTKYFADDPPSLFDELVQPQQLSIIQNSDPPMKFPDVTHLLNEEVTKPNVPNEVIDFWEPSPYLSATSTSSVPPPLTLPGMYTSVDYQDYIKEVSTALLGKIEAVAKRSDILSENDVTQDDRGLRQLILSGCFSAALNLTSRLLSVYGQGFNNVGQVSKSTPHSLGLWFTRLSLLLRLGQYDICVKEAEPFGKLNNPDMYFENYPELYPGRKGSLASFSFRLLLAELPIYKSRLNEAMNNLTELLETCKKIKTYFERTNSDAGRFWQRRIFRVMHSIINCAIMKKDHALATELLQQILRETDDEDEKKSLELALGRVFLQSGDIKSAEICFTRVFGEKRDTVTLLECINRGLVHVAKAEFGEALKYFTKGLELDDKNIMLHNNLAVCLLYTGQLKNAIRQFETAIELNPHQALNENLLLNLSTLYELESNDARTKKLALLRKVATYKPDLNCSVEVCLKLEYKRQTDDFVIKMEKKDTYVV
ncbi:trafficking protein particle complex subunit 12 [Culicoides brevitarsis]|uniref:trafficking protein particle complex subunit 12 n=1 Tax=Culicoides brevitarsis TaxID=469753 RepID=UPI00307C3928